MSDLVLSPLSLQPHLSLVDAVYETLLEAIVSGRIDSGTILSEVVVADQLQVSRTPVHDALRQLAKDGLVERSNNRRAKVTRFTRDDVYEIFELRKYLEGPAAELAALRMDRRQLQPLRDHADALAAKPRDEEWRMAWAVFDEEFHHTIASSSGNSRLTRDIGRYRLLHRGFNKTKTELASLEQALSEHYEILDALETHDSVRARDAMIAHIATWQTYFMQVIELST
ncbi:transcriptional regulator, GntR family [Pirellula staleyi DSM 6068]|uniref:Transcriptional regulator, GntR family n=1 Tax=Pirellula staleyi (strain ATCC 27377 / DSM 6068 / ICPB 4128) TaxID=530564 RepID=D2QYY4_PIRSD|nr:GntR family transcriptional regulator [Pirellula staleyi]ADB16439.1 transcriptional regulator, GntR family [Pirellula staleyi DSM 6068]